MTSQNSAPDVTIFSDTTENNNIKNKQAFQVTELLLSTISVGPCHSIISLANFTTFGSADLLEHFTVLSCLLILAKNLQNKNENHCVQLYS